MDTSVKNKKLQTLPWYALHDIAVKRGIEEKEVKGQEEDYMSLDLVAEIASLDDEMEFEVLSHGVM